MTKTFRLAVHFLCFAVLALGACGSVSEAPGVDAATGADGGAGDAALGGTCGAVNCDPHASCSDPGNSICECASGWMGDGAACNDFDECANNTFTCDPHAACGNIDGSYTCTCGFGYTGDGATCNPAWTLHFSDTGIRADEVAGAGQKIAYFKEKTGTVATVFRTFDAVAFTSSNEVDPQSANAAYDDYTSSGNTPVPVWGAPENVLYSFGDNGLRYNLTTRAWTTANYPTNPDLQDGESPVTAVGDSLIFIGGRTKGRIRRYYRPGNLMQLVGTFADATITPLVVTATADGTLWAFSNANTGADDRRLWRGAIQFFNPPTAVPTLTWQQMPSAPGRGALDGAVELDGKIWFGIFDPVLQDNVLAAFDPVTQTWGTDRLPLPAGESYGWLVPADGKMWFVSNGSSIAFYRFEP